MISVVERLSLPLVAVTLVNLFPHVVRKDSVVEFIDRVGRCRGYNQDNDNGQETAQAYDRKNDGKDETARASVTATGLVRSPSLATLLLWSGHCCAWLVRGSNDRRSRRKRNIGCPGGIRARLWLGDIRWRRLRLNACSIGNWNIRFGTCSISTHHLMLRGRRREGFPFDRHACFREQSCLSFQKDIVCTAVDKLLSAIVPVVEGGADSS